MVAVVTRVAGDVAFFLARLPIFHNGELQRRKSVAESLACGINTFVTSSHKLVNLPRLFFELPRRTLPVIYSANQKSRIVRIRDRAGAEWVSNHKFS